MKGTVLVVDDDRAMTKTICAILRQCGWETLQAFTGEEAVTAATRQSVSAVLMDVMMPGMNGVEAYRRIRDLQPTTSVILMTAGGGAPAGAPGLRTHHIAEAVSASASVGYP